MVRIHPVNNTFTLGAADTARAQAHLRITSLMVSGTAFTVHIYAPPPDDALRGVLYHAFDDFAICWATPPQFTQRQAHFDQLLQPSEEPAPPHLNSTATDTPTSSHSIRLPRLELLKFKGTPRNWPPFWEQFQTVVHENPALTDVDKFAYLQSSLTGPAAAAIAGRSASSRRHQDARAILIARFAKEDIIVKDHAEHLVDSQPNRSTADVRGLHRLYDNIEANIRGLRALKITEESFSTVLQPIILRSLPRELVLEYYRRGEQINEHPSSSGNDAVGEQTSSASQSSLRSLLDFINREVEARERGES
ncbi:uncharacterized protein LOC119391936 [Rhipicephalus sanguineus]|uniref:uncharacterized protein LOC119391936 n=1 Tax=Rhipicephalus sanguineus TaxID=34632 RepID=UPI0018931543|nr:uncharacterized protein LOC119391936 [Rhipicephalus sanguineus]